MGNWDESLVNAKYHVAVARRMFDGFSDYEDKRFLVGAIKELAKAAANLVRAFLIRGRAGGRNHQKNLDLFMKRIGPKYLSSEVVENIYKSLEIERAQKESPIEFEKRGQIILLIGGEYRFLTRERLGEFLKSVEDGVSGFSESFRQV